MISIPSIKGLEPIIPNPTPTKTVKPRVAAPARPKPATLVKIREPKKVKPPIEISSIDQEQVQPSIRAVQMNVFEKFSRLTCSREFSFFHKEIKSELRTQEHQLAFLQTKLNHLKNEFVNLNSEQSNLEQIRNYFTEALQKNIDRRIQSDEFITLAQKFHQDIKQVRTTSSKIFLWRFSLQRQLING